MLFVVHSAKLGGAQQVALGQARSLARDHELTIVTGHGPLRPAFAQLGPILRAPTRAPVWGASRRRWALDLARALPDAVRLAGVARRDDIDVIVANSTVLLAPVLAGRLAGLPVLVHAQEAPKSAAARRLFAFHGALADTVVAISPWIARSFAGSRARILDNPVGIRLPPAPQLPPLQPSRSPHVLVVGTIDAHKRQDLAIAAVAQLRDEGMAATLELVGPEADPAYARSLLEQAQRAAAGGAVTFAGPSDDVQARIAAADVVLVPAGEVTPLVLMEAMAGGTPVVAARMGSIPSVVADGTGLLVEPGDSAAMAAAIRRLTMQPGLARELAARARHHAQEHFDEDRSHARLQEELLRLAGRGLRREPSAASLVPSRA